LGLSDGQKGQTGSGSTQGSTTIALEDQQAADHDRSGHTKESWQRIVRKLSQASTHWAA
jgi:hypothetical protein